MASMILNLDETITKEYEGSDGSRRVESTVFRWAKRDDSLNTNVEHRSRT